MHKKIRPREALAGFFGLIAEAAISAP